jgi:uncharacterized protein YkwD
MARLRALPSALAATPTVAVRAIAFTCATFAVVFATTGVAPAFAAHSRSRAAAAHRSCQNASLRPTAQNLGLIRAATMCLVNRERRAAGERPLRPNARLRRAAQTHTRSMAFGDYFEHVGPGGTTPLARLRAVGYISSSRVGYEVGENIAWGTRSLATPRAIVAAWMASPAHRANILDRRYRETGIGVSPHPPASLSDGQPGAIYTQDFGVIIR